MGVLSELKPVSVWKYFEDICGIPRTSKHEEKIREFLLQFAAENKLEASEDEIGNIIIIRPASPGMEGRKTVVLQSHLDMVGEKNADHPHNWLNDPIIPKINGDWVSATGTTLGADDGIGIAAQMAILTDKEIKAGRIECLFTVDEESGMTGAINLKPDFFSGRILINLDSEDEGILYIGCAGGMDTVGSMTYVPVRNDKQKTALEIKITGLHGGHSGDEIHKGYANSIKIMTRIIRNIQENYPVALAFFDGGNLRNAIPREAFATIVCGNQHTEDIIRSVQDFSVTLADEFRATEKEMKISAGQVPAPEFVIDIDSQNKLLSALTCCPHGAIAWSKDMEDLVETSCNLASVKFSGKNEIKIVTTQRSSIESSKKEVAAMVETCLALAGAQVVHSDGYPGWRPNINSGILSITKSSYINLFAKEPKIRAIHAGLECGLIYEKFRGIDMISFGPTILGAHTPEEKIEIRTAQMFWDLLLDVLNNIPEETSDPN